MRKIYVTMEQTAALGSSFDVSEEEYASMLQTHQLPDRIMDDMIETIETMEPSERGIDYQVTDDREKVLIDWE